MPSKASEFHWFADTLSLWGVVSLVDCDLAAFFLDIVSIAFCQSPLELCDAFSLASFKACRLLSLLLSKDFLSLSALLVLPLSCVVVAGGSWVTTGGSWVTAGVSSVVVGGSSSVIVGGSSSVIVGGGSAGFVW